MSNLAITTALVASNQNTSRSNQKTAYCNAIMPKFNPVAATIQQKQNYASCVNHFYPSLTGVDIIAVKLLIVIGFIIAIAFGIKAFRERHDSPGYYILGGAIASILAPMFLALCYIALKFLFS